RVQQVGLPGAWSATAHVDPTDGALGRGQHDRGPGQPTVTATLVLTHPHSGDVHDRVGRSRHALRVQRPHSPSKKCRGLARLPPIFGEVWHAHLVFLSWFCTPPRRPSRVAHSARVAAVWLPQFCVLASSCSMACLKTSAGWAPISATVLTRKVGVDRTPSESPSAWSAAI